MTSDVQQHPPTPDDLTLPSAARLPVVQRSDSQPLAPQPPTPEVPWLIGQALNNQVNLAAELAGRFPNIPLLTIIKLRELDTKTGRALAVLTTADGFAMLRIEIDAASRLLEFTFSYGSMLGMRFQIDGLSNKDRTHFLDRMRIEGDHTAFLWGETRWARDYLFGVSRWQGKHHFINLYAFSRQNTEAAVRLKPDVTEQLMDWLQIHWKEDEQPTEEQTPIPPGGW